MKITDQNTAFQNELRKLLKKHHLSDKFYKSLCRDILKKPVCPREAPIVRVENAIKFVKRYVANPGKQRSTAAPVAVLNQAPNGRWAKRVDG